MHSSQKTDIIDLDLDRTFVVISFFFQNYIYFSLKSSKNHEKDLLIEDLNKQLRFQKFESDKRIKEVLSYQKPPLFPFPLPSNESPRNNNNNNTYLHTYIHHIY